MTNPQVGDDLASPGDEVGQVVVTEVATWAVVGLVVGGEDDAVGVDQLLVGVDHVLVGVSIEVLGQREDGVRVDQVVVVADRDERAGGSVETVVGGSGDPTVLAPPDQPPVLCEVGPLGDEVDHARIGRRVVDDDALPVLRGLGGNGVELRDQRGMGWIVDRQHDRDAGCAGAVERSSWHLEMIPTATHGLPGRSTRSGISSRPSAGSLHSP